ncbi:BatD family protein [Lysobacter sp. KIS68-7]|uniref:BatD family protein n=1 Tax=Lysobacter sp. KIS68-7 TaxID=2904252 RepID=UPI001E4B8FC1|nr:BatD family protein [Lysobacter sp. KIS68-7]UHQ20874.1 BatD family protein [Lysobacter sp. KIS68-7]
MRVRSLRVFLGACLALLCMATTAQAQVRAWLDRDRIESGESTTLNIAAESLTTAPDYAPLQRDFELSGHASQRSASIVNGTTSMHVQYSVELTPRRDGVITIPSLRVGNQTSPPLTLTVAPASRVPAQAGDIAFIESVVDDANPYVQQAVGLKLRLYYAVPLVSGQLDQPSPDGATLRKVGQDVQFQQELQGRRYNVVERHFLLIGEHSGRIVLPGARFRGQGVGGFIDDLFGDGRRPLAADAPPRTIDIKPIPANAPQPWLPLNDLRLRYTTLPQSARAGQSATVAIEAVADGAVGSQLPELQLASGAGAQVFPAASQSDETFDDGRPRTTLTRTFSIVPTRAGGLRVEAPRIEWWDVRAGVARTATLPPIVLQAAPGTASAQAPSAGNAVASAVPQQEDPAGEEGRIRIPGIQGQILPWAAAAALFAVLWLVTLLWALEHRHPPARAVAGDTMPSPPAPQAPDLRRALHDGDLADITDALCASVNPPAHDIDALHARLDDAAQRDALRLLQRARWSDGDPRVARDALRRAFAHGPSLAKDTAPVRAVLPPLYPPA